MKRLAISLSLSLALVGSAATAHAKKGGGKAAPAAEEGGGAGGDNAAAGGDKSAGQDSAPASESLDTTSPEGEPGKIEESLTEPKKQGPTTTLSWQDIVVVPRKAFIKSGRLELAPLAGITVNDNLIRHYMFGLDINYFLTDALWVGLQGQYFVKQLSTQAELVGLQFNRISTMNRYLYGAAFNMGYVPVYGKFAWFNRSIVHWEIWASAGVGPTFTEIISRNPADQSSKAFKNTALTPNFGIGSRFFLTEWLTVNFALRDYFIIDKYEPLAPDATDSADCKSHADSATVNNFIAYIGVGMYCPPSSPTRPPANGPAPTKDMPMLLNKHRFALLVALATVSLPLAAQAQRKSPLRDAPAIRKRFELRSIRFELGAGAGTTINQDFYHTVLINVRLAYHITDWVALGGFGNFGVAQIATGFEGKVVNSLDADRRRSNVQREPRQGGRRGRPAADLEHPGRCSSSGRRSPGSTRCSASCSRRTTSISSCPVALMNVKPGGSVARTCDPAAPTGTMDPSRYVLRRQGNQVGGKVGVGFHTFFDQTARPQRRAERRHRAAQSVGPRRQRRQHGQHPETCPGRTRSC